MRIAMAMLALIGGLVFTPGCSSTPEEPAEGGGEATAAHACACPGGGEGADCACGACEKGEPCSCG